MARALGCALLVGSALLGAPRVHADAGALLVVVESPRARQRSAIRHDVGAALAVEVVTMDDPRARAALGILIIAVVDAGRRALLFYRSRDGFQGWREASAPDDRSAGWIAEAAVALVSSAGQWRLQVEVLDPFGPGPLGPPTTNLPTGVLDPWGPEARATDARPRSERRPAAPRPVPPPAVVPVEPATGLSPPRP